MATQIHSQTTNIVVRGNFNPAIFQPIWFAQQQLLKPKEAEAAEIKIIHPEVAAFQVEWLQMRITRDRFQAATNQEPYREPLRDLVVGTFSLLSHTPFTALGVNHDYRFTLESEDAWHALGHRLAPKKDWEDVLELPGMVNLTMQGKRPDELNGYIQVTVSSLLNPKHGVHVNINDHYALTESSTDGSSCDALIDILSNRWSKTVQRGKRIAEHIVNAGERK
jgi:hypothetical protein